MEVGLIGTGRMGAGLVQRWVAAGHEVVAYDQAAQAGAVAAAAGAYVVPSLPELVQRLGTPRVIWLMVPAGITVTTVMRELLNLLEAGDTVIDGGNSHFKESQRRGEQFAKRGLHFIDVGVSGGVAGAQAGYALMIGGEQPHVTVIEPLFKALAAEGALAHVGPAGAGHFVKMVHNAIEYGMMQAIGEGFDLLKNGPYQDLDLPAIAGMWSHGTIIRSFLLECAAAALVRDKELESIAAYIDDSGEGRWSVEAAVEYAVPFWVNTAALYARFASREPDAFSAKLIAALRKEFGGHEVKRVE